LGGVPTYLSPCKKEKRGPKQNIFLMLVIYPCSMYNKEKRKKWKKNKKHVIRATTNQHPPEYHEGWMVSGQETVFC